MQSELRANPTYVLGHRRRAMTFGRATHTPSSSSRNDSARYGRAARYAEQVEFELREEHRHAIDGHGESRGVDDEVVEHNAFTIDGPQPPHDATNASPELGCEFGLENEFVGALFEKRGPQRFEIARKHGEEAEVVVGPLSKARHDVDIADERGGRNNWQWSTASVETACSQSLASLIVKPIAPSSAGEVSANARYRGR